MGKNSGSTMGNLGARDVWVFKGKSASTGVIQEL